MRTLKHPAIVELRAFIETKEVWYFLLRFPVAENALGVRPGSDWPSFSIIFWFWNCAKAVNFSIRLCA